MLRNAAFALALAAGVTGPAKTEDKAAALAAVGRDLWNLIQQIRSDLDSHTQQDPSLAPQRPIARSQAIPPAGSGGPEIQLGDLSRPFAIEGRLASLSRVRDSDLRITVPGGQARLGTYSVGSDQTVGGHLLVIRGNADVYGRVQGNLVALDGNVLVHPGAVIAGDVLAIHGAVQELGGEIQGDVRTLSASVRPATGPPLSPLAATLRRLAGFLGISLTLGMLGLAVVAFAGRNLEIVSDTVTHSFGRALVAGLLGEVLLLPTFGMIVVGLFLSVAGILLIPFAVIAFVVIAVVGLLGGYLAVAHALGESFTRRRMARGVMLGTPNSYRYLLVGLAGLVSLWGAWSLFGWVPVAGELIRGAAVLVTWLLGTAGFGAALLSRAGLREHFTGRIIPPEALTDEYLWATPQFGVPAVRRPGASRSSIGNP